MMPEAPLDNILVLDFGQIYNGPYCGLLLGFLGARVIKIEPPQGDIVRGRHADGEPYPYLWLNSNKESLVVDLKTALGRKIVQSLAAKADVVVENFNVGVMDRCGVGWDDLRKINPRLIFGSGKGFGLDGPNKDIPAMDLTIQAISGAMNSTGFPDGPPLKAGPAISDFMGGVHLCVAILAALHSRAKTGKGQLVEASMQETMVFALASAMGAHLDAEKGGKKVPPRTGNMHPGLAMAPYNVYPASDGHLAIICVSEKHWQDLALVVERADLLDDPRLSDTIGRAENMAVVDAAVSDWTQRNTKQEIGRILMAANVPFAPVKTLPEVTEDPHLLARGMWKKMPHSTRGMVQLPTSPVRLHDTPVRSVERIAPTLGEHTDHVLQDILGMSDAEIKALHKSKAIGAKNKS